MYQIRQWHKKANAKISSQRLKDGTRCQEREGRHLLGRHLHFGCFSRRILNNEKQLCHNFYNVSWFENEGPFSFGCVRLRRKKDIDPKYVQGAYKGRIEKKDRNEEGQSMFTRIDRE